MRIQIASDLHLEFFADRWPDFRVIESAPQADLLVLAGDIHNGVRALDAFAGWPVPIVYVPGNHEAYDEDLARVLAALRERAAGTNIHFLERDAVVLGGVRFLGTTMWTDFALDGADVDEAMAEANRCVVDFRTIRLGDRAFVPADSRDMHLQSRDWLRAQLDVRFDGPTVVVTHHGPHRLSVHPRYAAHPANPAFVSDLSALMGRCPLWIHGHVHDSFDYAVNGTRVIANPRGYSRDHRRADAPEHLLDWENQAFDGSLVVDVPS